MNPLRVHVIGTSGSGKTTIAMTIAHKLDIKHIELDAIHWQPDWTELSDDMFFEKVKEATENEAWTIDGNYRVVRDLIWERANTVVWLDLPFRSVFLRVLWRTLKRIVTREELWNSNKEGLRALFGSDSMPMWVIKTYQRRKNEYLELLERPECSHLDVKVFKSLKKTNAWINSLGN
jgi:adenylate kinase family enzyme